MDNDEIRAAMRELVEVTHEGLEAIRKSLDNQNKAINQLINAMETTTRLMLESRQV